MWDSTCFSKGMRTAHYPIGHVPLYRTRHQSSYLISPPGSELIRSTVLVPSGVSFWVQYDIYPNIRTDISPNRARGVEVEGWQHVEVTWQSQEPSRAPWSSEAATQGKEDNAPDMTGEAWHGWCYHASRRDEEIGTPWESHDVPCYVATRRGRHPRRIGGRLSSSPCLPGASPRGRA